MTTPNESDVEFGALDRYLRNEATSDDVRVVESWGTANRETWALLLSTRDALRDGMRVNSAAVLQRIKADIRAAEQAAQGAPVRRVGAAECEFSGRDPGRYARRRSVTRFTASGGGPSFLGSRPLRWGIALGAAALVGVAILRLDLRTTSSSDVARTYITPAGQRMAVTLSDGTRVVLGPQTSLVVGRGFGASDRKVALAGEAYFDVTRATGRPFTVDAGRVNVRVLGTAFALERYATDAQVRVAVVSGKIAVGVGRQQVVLTRRALARITDSTIVVMDGADLREATSWASGNLVFTDAPVADVLRTLGRWYGMEFRLADVSLARERMTVTLDPNARVETLGMLRVLLNVRMTIAGRVVTLTPMSAGTRRTWGEANDSLGITHMREAGR